MLHGACCAVARIRNAYASSPRKLLLLGMITRRSLGEPEARTVGTGASARDVAAGAAQHDWGEERTAQEVAGRYVGVRGTFPKQQYQPFFHDFAVQTCRICGLRRRRLVVKRQERGYPVEDDDPRRQWALVGDDARDECPGVPPA
jgi:hypothetical protein